MNARMVGIWVKHLCAVANDGRRVEAKWTGYGGGVRSSMLTSKLLLSPPLGSTIRKPHLRINTTPVDWSAFVVVMTTNDFT